MDIRHATRAIYGTEDVDADVSNCQIYKCWAAFRNFTGFWHLRNILVIDVQYGFVGTTPLTNTDEHITFNAVSNLVDTGLPAVNLTNSLLIAVTNGFTNFVGTAVQTNSSSSGIFQTVGSGACYLATNSPYEGVGTTNINATLLAALRERTTFPPLFLSNTVIATNILLVPIVLRDTNSNPSLGYHYDPLDYLVSGVTVSNSIFIATNGVAIGVDYSSIITIEDVEFAWGFILIDSKFISCGSPLGLNRVVRAHAVQERSSGNPFIRAMFYDGNSLGNSNEVRMLFNFCSQLAGDGYMLCTGTHFSDLEWTHSALYNCSVIVDASGGNYLTIGATNTLWERGGGQSGFGAAPSSVNTTLHMRNNLFRRSTVHFYGGQSSWTAKDNLVDGGGLYDHGTAITNGNNAYFQALTNLSSGASNLTLTNLSYVTGQLGDYYQPTNSSLLHTGSITANLVGLYHFTSVTNQVKEANSLVTIGLHYVALTANGSAIDFDSDGLADYWEDRNGNGTGDSGELNWTLRDTDGDTVDDGAELLQGRNPLGGTLTDTNNVLNLRVFTPLHQ